MHIHKRSMGLSQETHKLDFSEGELKHEYLDAALEELEIFQKKFFYIVLFLFFTFLLLKCNTPIDEKLYVPDNT